MSPPIMAIRFIFDWMTQRPMDLPTALHQVAKGPERQDLPARQSAETKHSAIPASTTAAPICAPISEMQCRCRKEFPRDRTENQWAATPRRDGLRAGGIRASPQLSDQARVRLTCPGFEMRNTSRAH